jgi:hypothetical protein
MDGRKALSYLSVDELQKALADGVFENRQDRKKAAGRALGTIVELITFYILREWGLGPTITIELAIPEFGNPAITHNVEFGLHPIIEKRKIELLRDGKPVTALKILKAIGEDTENRRTNTLLSSGDLQRNSCVLKETGNGFLVANLISESDSAYLIEVANLRKAPFAMVECKRVGIEDGAKKGPTTIEKAKQGAYVATHVSSLQKIRTFGGEMYGARAKPDGGIELMPWKEELRRLVYDCVGSELQGFVMTVGIVSNHGNWFTSDDPNKEMRVLKQSYDWLLFLNDGGIAEFVSDVVMSNHEVMDAVRKAFADSYTTGVSGKNQFTKVRISYKAHKVLCKYFSEKMKHIEEKWFSVLSPGGEKVETLQDELKKLRDKAWV